jgi:hypothetical protein
MYWGKPYLANDTPAREPASLGDVWSTSFESMRLLNNSISSAYALEKAYDDRIDQMKKAGVKGADDLVNPTRVWTKVDALRRNQMEDAIGDLPEEDPHINFIKRLKELEEKNPDKAWAIQASKSVRTDAETLARESEAKAADTYSRARGHLPGLPGGASLGGVMHGSFYDPINLASLAFGPWARVGVGAKAMLWNAAKTGMVNAGAETAAQPWVQQWRQQAGVDYGPQEALKNVAGAFAFGFGLDAGVRSIYRGFQRKVLGNVPYLEDPMNIHSGVAGYRAKPQDVEAALEGAAPKLPPDSIPHRASQGDLAALDEINKATGAAETPSVKGARAAAQTDDELRDVPPPLTNAAEGQDRIDQAIRMMLEDDEPPARGLDPVMPARQGDTLQNMSDDIQIPPGKYVQGGKSVTLEQVAAAEVGTDPSLFQFRRATNRSLDGATQWDAAAAGNMIVYERADGAKFVADGHARLSLAKRTGEPAVPAGHKRLYRGEGGSSMKSEANGIWWTTSRAKAEHYAAGGGKVRYMDIPDNKEGWKHFAEGTRDKFGDEWITSPEFSARNAKDAPPRIDIGAFVYREKDGWTPQEVKALAAKKNLQERPGSVSAIDAATIMREAPHMIDNSVSLTPTTMKQARGLAALSDEAFADVVAGKTKPDHAALVGDIVPDKSKHRAIVDALDTLGPKTQKQARAIIADLAKDTSHGIHRIIADAMSGNALIAERAKVLEAAIRLLEKDRHLFDTVARSALRIEQVPENLIDLVGSAEESFLAGALKDALDNYASHPGPMRDMIDEAARAVQGGAKVNDIAREFVDDLRDIVEREGFGAFAEVRDPVQGAGYGIDEPGGPQAKAQIEALEANLASIRDRMNLHVADRNIGKWLDYLKDNGRDVPELSPPVREYARKLVAEGKDVQSAIDSATSHVKKLENVRKKTLDEVKAEEEIKDDDIMFSLNGRGYTALQMEDVVAMQQFVKEWADKKEPESLVAFLIKAGGVKDWEGEVRSIIGQANQRPGLLSRTGKFLDDATLHAWEAGFLEAKERPEINDLLSAIADDIMGRRVVRVKDRETLDMIRQAQEARHELDFIGIRPEFGDEEIRAHLQGLDDDAGSFEPPFPFDTRPDARAGGGAPDHGGATFSLDETFDELSSAIRQGIDDGLNNQRAETQGAAGAGAEAPGLPGRGELPGSGGGLSPSSRAVVAAIRNITGDTRLAEGEALVGIPGAVEVPGRGKIKFGPFETARKAAEEYMAKAGLPYDPPTTYAKVDVERARRIADEYAKMAHDPVNPEVRKAYQAMIDETLAQYQAIKATGLKIEAIKPGQEDPYKLSPRYAILDVTENNHLWFYLTDEGFGSDASFDATLNPLLQLTGEFIDGRELRANDIFRIVHDYFGHIKEGVGFRAEGEENAWRSHSAMYSPLGRKAMTSETRGQNSWLNYGPHGDKNRTAKSEDTVYADQKVGLLPDWVIEEGAHDDPNLGEAGEIMYSLAGRATRQLKGAPEPGVGVAEGTKHNLVPELRVKAEGAEVPDKPLFTQKTNNANAARQIEALDTIAERFPDPNTGDEWSRMMAYALGDDDVPVPPYGLLRDLASKDPGRLSKLTKGQIADADHGMKTADVFGSLYARGAMDVADTGKLFMWSILSRGVSPYTQESLFIDAFKSADAWIKQAAEGKFDAKGYAEWAKTVAPAGTGRPGAGASHNLNSFGSSFLARMGERGPDGKTHLQRMHEMLSDPAMSGQRIRREFLRIGESVGIDNKVMSFTLLVSGRKDVMVIDRVQARNLYDDGRFAHRNIYDGEKPGGKFVAGSRLADQFYGARGLVTYEAIERLLGKRIKGIYERLGRGDAASIGRYHWESWVVASQQEAAHGTIDAIMRAAQGERRPLAGVTAKQGEYGAYAYGARYGRDERGQPAFSYDDSKGVPHRFTVPRFRQLLDEMKNPKSGVVPKGFKVSEVGNAPWYTQKGVNREALDALIAKYGRPEREGKGLSRLAQDQAADSRGPAEVITDIMASLAGRALPADEASRHARARAMGFDVDNPLYVSAIQPIDAFDPHGKFGGHKGISGISLTDNPELASRYLDRYATHDSTGKPFQKNMMKVFIKPGVVRELDAPIPGGPKTGYPLPKDYKWPKSLDGVDTVIFPDAVNRPGKRDAEVAHRSQSTKTAIKGREYILRDPSRIRSVNAMFDPAEEASADIMASLAGRQIDELGFYSKALESAKALKQAKGTGEQMLSMLKGMGVKEAEIKTLGLDKYLSGKKQITRDEIVGFIEEGRTRINEAVYAGDEPSAPQISEVGRPRRSDEDENVIIHDYQEETTGLSYEVYVDKEAGNVSVRTEGGDWLEIGRPLNRQSLDDAISAIYKHTQGLMRENAPANVKGSTRWEDYALDGSNPTYAETVLSLADEAEESRLRYDQYDKALRDKYLLPKSVLWTDVVGTGRITPEEEAKIADLLRKAADKAAEQEAGFTSGHWPGIRNILAHVRHSIQTAIINGKKVLVFLIDELQSDWGQKLRDGGVRDEAKIAELHNRLNEAIAAREEAHAVFKEALQKESDHALFDRLQAAHDAAKSKADLLAAELHTATAATPGHPMVNTTDQWVTTAMRRAIRMAVESGAEGIAITPGKLQAERFGLSQYVNRIDVHLPGSEDYTVAKGERLMALHGNREGLQMEVRVADDGTIISANGRDGLEGKQLAELLGKERAERLLAIKQTESIGISGSALDLGGEGMRAVYDNIYPRTLGKLLGKMDGEIKRGLTELKLHDGSTATREAARDSYNRPIPGEQPEQFHYFPITDKVRKEVMEEGQPMFAARPEPTQRQLAGRTIEQLDHLLMMGKGAEIHPAAVWRIQEALRPHLHMVPEDVPVGVLKAIEPKPSADNPYRVKVTFHDPRGDEFSFNIDWLKLRLMEGGYVPSIKAVVFIDYSGGLKAGEGEGRHIGVNADATKILRGDVSVVVGTLFHELTHLFRDLGRDGFTGDFWALATRIVHEQKILDMPLGQFLAKTGREGFSSPKSIRQVYQEFYAGRANMEDKVVEEGVAHLVELARVRALPPEVLNQLKPLMDAMWGEGNPINRAIEAVGNDNDGGFVMAALKAWSRKAPDEDEPKPGRPAPAAVPRSREGYSISQNLGDDGAGGFRYVLFRDGEPIGKASGFSFQGTTVHISWISGDLGGVAGIRALREAFREDFPRAREFAGSRISGAKALHAERYDLGEDGEDISAPMQYVVMPSIGGPRSKSANLIKLEMAQAMENAGRTPEEIWQVAKWGRDESGKWYTEIPDNKAKLTEVGKSKKPVGARIEDVIDHPMQFEAYPELKRFKIELERTPTGDESAAKVPMGEADMAKKKITVRATNLGERRKLILAELQKFINRAEGFSESATPDTVRKSVRGAMIKADRDAAEMLERYANGADDDLDALANEIRAVGERRLWLETLTDMTAYRALAAYQRGSVVMRRADMPKGMRDAIPPSAMMQVPFDRQIPGGRQRRQFHINEEDEFWEEVAKKAYGKEQAAERKGARRARPDETRDDSVLGQKAAEEFKKFTELQRKLFAEGRSVGEVAQMMEKELGYPVDPGRLAAGEVWWNMESILQRRPWPPEMVERFTALKKEGKTQKQIVDQLLLEYPGRNITPDAIRQRWHEMGMANTLDGPAIRAHLKELAEDKALRVWSERATTMALEAREAGLTYADIAKELNTKLGTSDFSVHSVNRLFKKLGLTKKEFSWANGALDDLTSDDIANMSHAEAAAVLSRKYGTEITDRAVMQRRYRLRKEQRNGQFEPEDIENAVEVLKVCKS